MSNCICECSVSCGFADRSPVAVVLPCPSPDASQDAAVVVLKASAHAHTAAIHAACCHANECPTPRDCRLSVPTECVLQAALSRELALIQGPPGTGKTYVGIQAVKALLANTSGNAKGLDPGTGHTGHVDDVPSATDPQTHPCVGPVLIVCFTNHALDQFLEGLLAVGLTDMVRVGGRYMHWYTKLACCMHCGCSFLGFAACYLTRNAFNSKGHIFT